jgi:hypothetical protein
MLENYSMNCVLTNNASRQKAECRFLRSLGGDSVGMSTIPEVVAAHHCAMQVLCLSLITNKVIMEGDEGRPVASHAEVLEAVAKRSVQMQELVKNIIKALAKEVLPNLPDLPTVDLSKARLQHKKKKMNEAFRDSRVSYETLFVGALLFAAGSMFSSFMRKGRPSS